MGYIVLSKVFAAHNHRPRTVRIRYKFPPPLAKESFIEDVDVDNPKAPVNFWRTCLRPCYPAKVKIIVPVTPIEVSPNLINSVRRPLGDSVVGEDIYRNSRHDSVDESESTRSSKKFTFPHLKALADTLDNPFPNMVDVSGRCNLETGVFHGENATLTPRKTDNIVAKRLWYAKEVASRLLIVNIQTGGHREAQKDSANAADSLHSRLDTNKRVVRKL